MFFNDNNNQRPDPLHLQDTGGPDGPEQGGAVTDSIF